MAVQAQFDGVRYMREERCKRNPGIAILTLGHRLKLELREYEPEKDGDNTRTVVPVLPHVARLFSDSDWDSQY